MLDDPGCAWATFPPAYIIFSRGRPADRTMCTCWYLGQTICGCRIVTRNLIQCLMLCRRAFRVTHSFGLTLAPAQLNCLHNHLPSSCMYPRCRVWTRTVGRTSESMDGLSRFNVYEVTGHMVAATVRTLTANSDETVQLQVSRTSRVTSESISYTTRLRDRTRAVTTTSGSLKIHR